MIFNYSRSNFTLPTCGLPGNTLSTLWFKNWHFTHLWSYLLTVDCSFYPLVVISVNSQLLTYPLAITLTPSNWKTDYKLNQTQWILEKQTWGHPFTLSLIEPLHQDHRVKYPSSILITISIKTPVIDFEEVRVDVKFQVRSLT